MTVEDGRVYLERLSLSGGGAEPIFILRGRDVSAPSAVLAWAMRAESVGVNPQKIAGAYEAAAAMLLWPQHRKPD
jgi:hypothetical protein